MFVLSRQGGHHRTLTTHPSRSIVTLIHAERNRDDRPDEEVSGMSMRWLSSACGSREAKLYKTLVG